MAKWLDKYEQSECDSCKKAQLGKKYGKSEDEVRRAILKKADEVFTSGKKPYELPESVLKAGANKGYVCIRGVCGILTDAGFLPDKYYTNTSFAKDAPELGFGNPQTNINLLKEGDVFMHLADKNEQGNLYPSHAEIFKGWDGDMGEFYDYYDLYNSPYKTNGIRRYAKSELENRLRRKAQNDQSDTQAQFYSLAGSEAKTEKPYPYNLPENELKDWYERTHASNTTFIAPDSKIDRDMPLYYASGENIRQDTKDELVSMFNNKDLDKQLKRELKITDHDLQRIKPLIYGVIGQESQFNNPRSVTAGAKYMYENMFSPEGNSLGPGQVKLKSITPAVREAFGIAKGEDLQNLKNTYIGLTDIISNAVNYTDKYVTEETHPDLVDKDRFERALYFLNSPGKVRKSDSQNYNESLDDASYFSRLTEEGRQENVNRANKTKLSMDPGSYPAKVLERAKELQTKIKYEDPSILPDVLVTSTKKENGGWLDKYEQGGLILKKKTKDNYGKKPNVNDVQASAGPNFVGEGYTAYNWKSPAWGGQFAMGGSLPGSVGFTYARVAGSAPANGKYTKKTKASAQDGKVLSPDADDRLMLGFNTSDPAFQNVKSNAFVPFDRKDFEGIKQGIAGYMNSPLYMERLSKSIPDAENAKETQQRRLNNLLSIKLNPNTVNEGTHYNSNKNRINLGATDFVDNATLSHEVAHGIVPNLTNSYGKQNMFAKAANVVGDLFQPFEQFSNSELEKINRPLSGKITAPNFDYMMARKEEHYKPQGSKASAKTAANETYGDLTGMRQLLLDNGITTEFGQDLTPEIFKKATENKRVMNSPAFKRMKLKFKDEDIIKMNNEVARLNGTAPVTQAQNGQEMKFYQDGLDFKPKSISKKGKKIVKDDRGQWAHPGEVTEISSPDITMQGVDYPVLGISDTGDTQMMYPDQDYKFDGEKVTEYPMAQNGKWLDKYKDPLINLSRNDQIPAQPTFVKEWKQKEAYNKQKKEREIKEAQQREVNNRSYISQDRSTTASRAADKQRQIDDYVAEAQRNSPLAQTLGSFTASGNNPEAGAIAARTISDMNPIMSGVRMSRAIRDPENNPYGIGQGKGYTSNILGGIGLLGDVFDVGAIVTSPAFRGAANMASNIDRVATRTGNSAGAKTITNDIKNAFYKEIGQPGSFNIYNKDSKNLQMFDAAGKEIATQKVLKPKAVQAHNKSLPGNYKTGATPPPPEGLAPYYPTEIDWGKWNPEIPKNFDLLQEYVGIEQDAKMFDTWMKNPDGSKFAGTPEQFVQSRSENFKKAFPQGADVVYRGDRSHYEAIRGKGEELYGKPIFTTPDKELAKLYAYKEPITSPYYSPNIETVEQKLQRMYGPDMTVEKLRNEYPEIAGRILETNDGGLYELAIPKTTNELTFNAGKNLHHYLSNPEVYDKLIKEGIVPHKRPEPGIFDTDNIAELIEKTGLDRATIKNVNDGKIADVLIHNQRPGKYAKSLRGNNGMFDMNNPNIYKALIPAVGIAGIAGASKKKKGGWLNKYK